MVVLTTRGAAECLHQPIKPEGLVAVLMCLTSFFILYDRSTMDVTVWTGSRSFWVPHSEEESSVLCSQGRITSVRSVLKGLRRKVSCGENNSFSVPTTSNSLAFPDSDGALLVQHGSPAQSQSQSGGILRKIYFNRQQSHVSQTPRAMVPLSGAERCFRELLGNV